MKKRFRYFFNMIEIALAIAIIAIGISSIMVLFPVGLNATNSAIADNNIPDAAEYLLSYLEATAGAEWRDSAGNAAISPSKTLGKLPYTKPSVETIKTETAPSTNWTAITGLKDIYAPATNTVGYYKFLKDSPHPDDTNVRIPDFTAIAVTWVERAYFHNPLKGNCAVLEPKVGVVLCVEMSWPAEKPYEQREKRLYKMTLFNPAAKASDITVTP